MAKPKATNGNDKHEKLCEAAKEAIDQVHGDTSVTRGQTLTSLKDVREHLDLLVFSLENDDADDADEE